jgi:hypothetical protein
MVRRSIWIVLFITVACGLGGIGYWAWNQWQQERNREAVRELSIKEPSRRIVDPKTHEVMIRLDRQAQERLRLAVQPVEQIQWRQKIKLLGYTIQVPDRVAEIRSPWTGILELPPDSPMPKVGEKISAGRSLGVLRVQWSPSDRIQLENQLSETRGIIGETDAEIAVVRETISRLKKIGEGSLAGKQLPEAEGQLAKLEARLAAAKARGQALEKAIAKESDVRFSFAAPQAGLITAILRRPGEVVSAGDLIATVYDPSQLWVSAKALPGQLGADKIPSQARLSFPGFAFESVTAELVGVNPQADRTQQALEIVYSAANPQGRIPVGLQAEAAIDAGAPHQVVKVPRSAVLRMNQRRLIYLQLGDDTFAKQFVEAEGEDADFVYLKPSFAVDKKIVYQGAQSLFSEEYKESIQLIEDTGAPGQTKETSD